MRPSSVLGQDGVVAVDCSWCLFLGAVVVAALLRLLLDDWFAVSPVSCVPGQTPESRWTRPPTLALCGNHAVACRVVHPTGEGEREQL